MAGSTSPRTTGTQNPQFGCLLKEVKFTDTTTGIVLFDGTFNQDNLQYLPPRCGTGTTYFPGCGYYSGADCEYSDTCLAEPPPIQAPDPNPIADIENPSGVAPGSFSSTKQYCATCPTGYVNLSTTALVPSSQPSVTGPNNIQATLGGLLWQLPIITGAATTIGQTTIPQGGGQFPINLQQGSTWPTGTILYVSPNGAWVPLKIVALGSGTNYTVLNVLPDNEGLTIPSGSTMYILLAPPYENGDGSACPPYTITSEVIQGEPGAVYTVGLRLRGVIESIDFTNSGTAAPPEGTQTGYVLKLKNYVSLATLNGNNYGGLDPSSGNNEYILIIDDPNGTYSATYCLNSAAGGSPAILPGVVDYDLSVQIPSGATVTLAAYAKIIPAGWADEFPNSSALVVSGSEADPGGGTNYPLSTLISQPVTGQFLQLDVESISGASSSAPLPETIEWTFSAGTTVSDYSITNAGSNYPTAWTLSGSNNGTTWTLLDQRTDLAFVTGQTLRFPVENPAAFTYYQLTVTATSDGNAPNIGTPSLYAPAPTQQCASSTQTGASQSAADASALSAATTAAQALLNCEPVWTSTQNFKGSDGNTYSATAESYNSQTEADNAALALAQAQAP